MRKVNTKNNQKRKSVTLIKTAHQRVKLLAVKAERPLDKTLDEVVFAGLKALHVPMMD